MKLTTTMQVSVDGVMQGPGARDDELAVFERRGWAHFDNEAGKVIDEIYQRADAFLFGRLTYKHFAATWEHGTIRATAQSGRHCTRSPGTWHRPHSPTRGGRIRLFSRVILWPPSAS